MGDGMARAPILAAGGIVVRGGSDPLVAIVRLRKGDWVLPKGKLNERESALAAARREVLEETGQDVTVQEFLGTMSYDVAGTPKIVQFWRMQALEGPARKPAHDVRAVQWLPLAAAVKKLTHVREQVFLANVGPAALKGVERAVHDIAQEQDIERTEQPGVLARMRAWLQGP
jgi:8-oxo-dGTP diphosphatase